MASVARNVGACGTPVCSVTHTGAYRDAMCASAPTSRHPGASLRVDPARVTKRPTQDRQESQSMSQIRTAGKDKLLDEFNAVVAETEHLLKSAASLGTEQAGVLKGNLDDALSSA